MRKEKMITRTIVSNMTTIMCVDVTTKKVENMVIEIVGEHEPETILKVAKKEVETNTFKVVTIVNIERKEKLYGMSEKQFLSIAKELPPR